MLVFTNKVVAILIVMLQNAGKKNYALNLHNFSSVCLTKDF